MTKPTVLVGVLAAAIALGGCGGSHRWSSETRANFVNACVANGSSSATRQCAVDYVEARLSESELAAQDDGSFLPQNTIRLDDSADQVARRARGRANE
jgi:hypothetical protein